MTRILLITDIFPPDIGGPATFINQLGHQLAQLDYRVTVVCTSEQDEESTDKQRPYKIRRIRRRPSSLQHSLRVRAILAQEIRRHDLIFSNGLEYPTFQVCRLLRRPYLLKVVGDSAWETARNTHQTLLSIDEFQSTAAAGQPWEKLVHKRTAFARHAQRVITPSHYLRRIVIGWGVPPERVVTIYNGVPLETFTAFQPRPRKEETLNLLFIGRLANWKGVDTLIKATAELHKVQLTIVGDGPEMAPLRQLAHQLGAAEQVVFKGAQSKKGVHEALEQAHALALISAYEGLSHTVLEACAAAVPCIVSDCGGNPEIISHAENGLVVPYGDVSRLRDAIRQLQADESLRYRLAVQAQVVSRRFNFADTVRQTAALLLSAPD
jgi:glycosyltransferase involved in cell wall biosynthesis